MTVVLADSIHIPLISSDDAKRALVSFFFNVRSPLTAKEYYAAALEFFKLVSMDVLKPSDLKRQHIIFYRRWLEDKGLAHKTIQKKLSAISALCRFLAEEGFVEKDITYGVSRPLTQNKRETADISDEDVKRIFASLDETSYTFFSHRAILAIGFYVGLRSSEIRNLRLENIGIKRGLKILNLTIKGGRVHEIPLHPFVILAVDEHIDVLKKRGFELDEPGHVLFPSLKTRLNCPMSAEALSYIFRTALKRAEVSLDSFQRYSPHSMRATFAGHLLNSVDARLEDVQRALGHSNPATTQKYNKRTKGHEKSPVFKIDY